MCEYPEILGSFQLFFAPLETAVNRSFSTCACLGKSRAHSAGQNGAYVNKCTEENVRKPPDIHHPSSNSQQQETGACGIFKAVYARSAGQKRV
jgi:hypothetical protein